MPFVHSRCGMMWSSGMGKCCSGLWKCKKINLNISRFPIELTHVFKNVMNKTAFDILSIISIITAVFVQEFVGVIWLFTFLFIFSL